MQETRRYKVTNRVFGKRDLRNIANAFIFERDKLNDGTEPDEPLVKVCFAVECKDDTSYSSDGLDLFQEAGPLDTKTARSIRFTLDDYFDQKRAVLSLSENKYMNTLLTVCAHDTDWVSGTFTRIQEQIEAASPQHKCPRIVTLCCIPFLCLGIAWIVFFLFGLIIPFIVSLSSESRSDCGFQVLFAESFKKWWNQKPLLAFWAVGSIPAACFFRNWVMGLWPRVELDVGPQHKNIRKQRRGRIIAFAGVILVPLLLTMIYDIIKGIVFGL